MILCGLDTVVVGNIDHLADYCLNEKVLALPEDPNHRGTGRVCNGVSLIPGGYQCIYRNWNGENDMAHLQNQRHILIDGLFPGAVVYYKCDVKRNGLGDARIVYFHGDQKPHEIDDPFIKEHWI